MEFCSDFFLLPMGLPNTVDSIHLETNSYLRNPDPPFPNMPYHMYHTFPSAMRPIPPVRRQNIPTPPPRGVSRPKPLVLPSQTPEGATYYRMLVDRLEFNNNSYVSQFLPKPPRSEAAFSSTSLPSLPPPPPERTVLRPVYKSSEHEQYI